ncbi:MAG: hypothetical protein MAG715_00791 [Methanonatronarchaeales archaeon]|nr:hypothetical protein [Methanonatronarchaeales archaeon]
MASREGSGLQSSAGLLRYFEDEDSQAPRMSPRGLVVGAAVLGLVVLSLNAYYGAWP